MKKEIDPEKALRAMPLMFTLAIMGCIGVIFMLHAAFLDNYLPLTIEITFGTFIAWIVFNYSKKWDRENKKAIKEAQQLLEKVEIVTERQDRMIGEQYDREQKRKIAFGRQAIDSLNVMINNYNSLKELLAIFIKNGSDENKNKIIGFSKNMSEATQYYHVPHMRGTLSRIAELLSDPYLAIQIDSMTDSFVFAYVDILNGSVWMKDYDLHEKITVLDNYVKQLESLKNKLENEIPQAKIS